MISVLIELRTYDSSNLEMVRGLLILSEWQSAERMRRGVFGSGGAALASSGSCDNDDEEPEASAVLVARRAARRTTIPNFDHPAYRNQPEPVKVAISPAFKKLPMTPLTEPVFP
jgi:hypothetical protein